MSIALEIIQKGCGFKSVPHLIRPLSGGDINDVYLISVGAQNYVVKQNDADRFPEMLEKEYRAMLFLNQKLPAAYPQPIAAFTAKNQQYFVLEYRKEGQNTNEGQQKLTQQLAKQHRISNSSFGWEEDNYIGQLPQINTASDNWSDFFAEHRLLFQAKMAFDSGLLTSTEVQQMESLCQCLDELIPQEKPALLHGDLWGGNYFISSKGKATLYDPAIYYGHREMDLAMTCLFGGFNAAFYRSYEEAFPLEKGWENRVPIGQLYPNLVHLNLFGSAYHSAITSVINRF